MKKPTTHPVSSVQGTKLTPAEWSKSFGTTDFRNLDGYSIPYLEQVLKDSWAWFLRHQLCMDAIEADRYTRARDAIKKHIQRRV